MKTTVIYHRADFDGIFCREIAKKFLPEAELIGWDYGDPLVQATGQVYVLDLSPACRAISHLREQSLIWIDHHKSSIDAFPPDLAGYRIDGVAACRLAWQWFSRDHTDPVVQYNGLPSKEEFTGRTVIEPWAVRLAGEYDIWDKRDPDAELFQHGLRSCDVNFDLLLEDNTEYVQFLLENGRALQYAKTKENESIIKAQGFTVKWEGQTFLVCNHARFDSHLFTAGIKPEHTALLGFSFNGKQYKVSLYHCPGHEDQDLSLIAVKYNGGGHRGACGFACDKLPFI